MQVHSKSMARVLQGDGIIHNYDTYYRDTRKYDSLLRTQPSKARRLELRFTQRICNNDKAFETGYYKGSYFDNGKTTHTYYGKFTVLLAKEGNIWKIIMDSDTSTTIDETVFLSAKPLHEQE